MCDPEVVAPLLSHEPEGRRQQIQGGVGGGRGKYAAVDGDMPSCLRPSGRAGFELELEQAIKLATKDFKATTDNLCKMKSR
eukprot:4331766-Karenia_brevis.AAC.1